MRNITRIRWSVPACLGMILSILHSSAWAQVDDKAPDKKDHRKNVAILVYEGVELLDFAGPGEVFSVVRNGGGDEYRVYTVAETKNPIVSQGFLTIVPEFSLSEAPQPYILIIPGGRATMLLKSEAVIAWIKQVAARAKVTTSVCNGALALARAGLLDGLEATTHWGTIDRLRREAPNTQVHENRRFVDNGKIITAAGVSAGIDMALHIVSTLNGKKVAKGIAHYMEYDWTPEPALLGLDPIALTEGKKVAGTMQFETEHAEFRYVFASKINLAKFKSDPARYGIQAKGSCSAMPRYKGKSKIFTVHKGKIYIFASNHCKKDFEVDPEYFLMVIDELEKKGELCKNCS